MRALALSLAIVGLFVLSYFVFSAPEQATNLDEHNLHKIVVFTGKVSGERVASNQHYFYVGNISVQCSCGNRYFERKNVSVLGFVEQYNGNFYARALKIGIN